MDIRAYPFTGSDVILPFEFKGFDLDGKTGVGSRATEKSAEDEKEERQILCRNCKAPITGFNNIIEIEGRHEHTFSNPHGIVFTIGCFSDAEGCINEGIPTTEFTWFSGYSWRFSLCCRCFLHLGWHYQSRHGEIFYGLILSNLIH